MGTRKSSDDVPPKWSVEVLFPSQIESLVLAGDVLLAAGPVDKLHRGKGAFLRAYNPKDGAQLKEWKLKSPPVADGLAVAKGCVYASCQDGKVVCLK